MTVLVPTIHDVNAGRHDPASRTIPAALRHGTGRIDMRRHDGSLPRSKSAEAREFGALLTIAFVFFLAAALIGRVLPARWRPWPPSGRRHRSVVAEARAAADAFMPFALMG